jgi:4-hydroxybenzoate polyprenyltransferase
MTPQHASDRSDIRATGLVALLPAGLRPYAHLSRLDRPIGWWLLLLPCWWALALAWPRPLDWTFVWYAALFWIGAVAMRGAGCTYNDIVDRDFDARVARTATRPIPSGQVSVAQATAWMVAQALVGLAVLLQFNWLTVGLGAASLGLVAIYPFMKRVTWWPQAFLGLAFNWGAIVGWTAATGSLDWAILPLYLANGPAPSSQASSRRPISPAAPIFCGRRISSMSASSWRPPFTMHRATGTSFTISSSSSPASSS